MSDTTYEVFQHYGTSTDRLAFTPDPAVGIQPLYIWYETDTGKTYLYHTAWVELVGGGGGNNLASYLLEGGGIAWVSGYDFDVAAASYIIQGFRYTSAADTVTLSAADPDDPRIDVIAVNTSGAVVVIEGTPSATPSEPSIDPATQLKLGIILIPADTEPAATNTDLFLEGAGDPTEWNWTSSGAGWTLPSTNNPRTGTYDIESTNLPANSYVQGEKGTGSFDPSTVDILVIYIRSKVAWGNNKNLVISLRLNGVLVGLNITVARIGTYGFDSANTSTYQLLAIPLTAFAVPAGNLINQVRITGTGSGTTQGFYLDDILFQVSGAEGSGGGLTLTEADARYMQRANNLSDVASIASATAALNAVVGDSGAGGTKGLVPAPAAGDAAANKFLKASGAWAVPADVDTGITQLTGEVTAGPGNGSQAATITAKAVTNAKMADMAQSTFKARKTASTGEPEDVSAADATALLAAMVGDSGSGGTKGLAPAPGSGDAAAGKYLKASGVWDVPAGTASGDVVGPASAEADNIAVYSGTTGKLIKDGGSTIAEVLAAAGDVDGPASSEDNNVAQFNGVSGKIIEDSGYTVAEIIAAGAAAAPQGDVTAAANIDDNHIVRGDGGTKGVQKSGITIDDSDNVTDVVSLAIGAALTANTKLTVAGQLHIVPSNHSAAGATETIDFAVSNEHTVILDESVTLTLSNPVDGGRYTIVLIQDGSGGNTVTWPAAVKWPGGTTPTITATGNKADLVTLYYYATGSVYFASINQNYATS